MSLSLKTKICSKLTNLYLKTKYDGLYEKDLFIRKKYSNNKGMRVIVSLTSFSKRLANLHIVIKSLLSQTYSPDLIVLYLGDDVDETNVPDSLKNLEKYKFKIVYGCENLKPHKKYFFAMQEYSDDIIITVDDDAVYDKNLVRDLMKTHLKNPGSIVARRVNRILFDEYGNINPYNDWLIEDLSIRNSRPSFDLIATGVGGVLYPPHLINKILFDKSAIIKTSLLADDLWLKYVELISHVPVVRTSGLISHPFVFEDSDNTGLAKENVLNSNNDRTILKIEEYFGKTMKQLINECEETVCNR